MDLIRSLPSKLLRRPTTMNKIYCTILLFQVASASLGDYLAGASQSWWMTFGVLPSYTYVSGLLLPTILVISAHFLLAANLPSALSSVLRNTRLIWRPIARVMFYQNCARQGFRLTLWALGAASAALPAWLWWLDAVVKPIRLVIQLLLINQEMVWAVCLAFIALSIISAGDRLSPVTYMSGFWSDVTPWMNSAESLVNEDKATGLGLAFCFAGVKAVFHGTIAGTLPTVLHHLLISAGAMVATLTYTNFTCTSFLKQAQKNGLVPEVENQGWPRQAQAPVPANERQLQMHE